MTPLQQAHEDADLLIAAMGAHSSIKFPADRVAMPQHQQAGRARHMEIRSAVAALLIEDCGHDPEVVREVLHAEVAEFRRRLKPKNGRHRIAQHLRAGRRALRKRAADAAA